MFGIDSHIDTFEHLHPTILHAYFWTQLRIPSLLYFDECMHYRTNQPKVKCMLSKTRREFCVLRVQACTQTQLHTPCLLCLYSTIVSISVVIRFVSIVGMVVESLVQDLYLSRPFQNAETSQKLETVESKLLWQLQAEKLLRGNLLWDVSLQQEGQRR